MGKRVGKRVSGRSVGESKCAVSERDGERVCVQSDAVCRSMCKNYSQQFEFTGELPKSRYTHTRTYRHHHEPTHT